jgi:hypothetical protein
MRRKLTAFGLVLTAVVTAGCLSRPYAKNGSDFVKSSGLGWKHVQSKREPIYLIAADGTECTVSKERFARVQPGESALCVWRQTPP